MEREWIVKAGRYPLRFQVLCQRLPVPGPDDIEMIDGPAVLRLERHRHVWARRQVLGIPGGGSAALGRPALEMPQLDAQETCLNRIEPAVVALEVVIVLLGLTVLPQHLYRCRDRCIVGGDGNGFTTRA